MKQLLLFSLTLFIAACNLSCNGQNSKKENTQQTLSNKVEVYYFHFSRRCATCNAVESESKKAVETLYPDRVKKGDIVFYGVNLDEETSKAAAEKCQASGQSLLVISGNKRADLTPQGFMYALSNPAKLKEEIKKAIDPLLASN